MVDETGIRINTLQQIISIALSCSLHTSARIQVRDRKAKYSLERPLIIQRGTAETYGSDSALICFPLTRILATMSSIKVKEFTDSTLQIVRDSYICDHNWASAMSASMFTSTFSKHFPFQNGQCTMGKSYMDGTVGNIQGYNNS